MEFNKYNSITNAYQVLFIEQLRNQLPPETIWVMTEKLHGANFSIWYDGKDFKFGRRVAFLVEGENFFNYKSVMTEDLLNNVKMLWEYTEAKESLVVYGELHGPGIANRNQVDYGTEKKFAGFDVVVDGKTLSMNNTLISLIYCRINVPAILGTGTLDEVLAKSPEFFSGDITGNLAEGFVAVPAYKTLILRSGKRAILKIKNEKWAESKTVKVRKTVTLTEEQNTLLAEITSHVTENRVDSAISKGFDTFGSIMRELVSDCLLELGEYNKKDWKVVSKPFARETASKLRTWLGVRGII